MFMIINNENNLIYIYHYIYSNFELTEVSRIIEK